MIHTEWNGGLLLEIYKTTKLEKYYRCGVCKSTWISVYVLETGFGDYIKIKCHECGQKLIYNDDNPGCFEEITADQVIAEDIHHRKIGRIKHPENELAPIEYKNAWTAQNFCKYNRCALCLGEIIPKIVEPCDDFFNAHYNIECKIHGLLIKGGTTDIWTMNEINSANSEREFRDRELTEEEKKGIEKINKMSDDEFLDLFSCNK